MEGFPTLYTERLKLRKIEFEDIPNLIKYANNKKIADRIVNIPFPYREPDAAFRMSYVVQGFKKKARYTFSITWKKTNELIGEISLHLLKDHRGEIGYWIGEPLWNQGIGTEAVGAVIKFGIEQLQLQEITASCKADNIASSKVLMKNGMKETVRTGQLIQYHLKPNS